MPPNYFIDSHCHMFTIADIPLFQTIKQFAHDKTGFKGKLLIPLISFYLPLINAEEKVEKLEKFMRYFENEPEENVRQLTEEVTAILNGDFGLVDAKTVLTPLVMDFDHGGGVRKLAKQVDRLNKAISGIKQTRVKILPFMGLDPNGASLSIISTISVSVADLLHFLPWGGHEFVIFRSAFAASRLTSARALSDQR